MILHLLVLLYRDIISQAAAAWKNTNFSMLLIFLTKPRCISPSPRILSGYCATSQAVQWRGCLSLNHVPWTFCSLPPQVRACHFCSDVPAVVCLCECHSRGWEDACLCLVKEGAFTKLSEDTSGRHRDLNWHGSCWHDEHMPPTWRWNDGCGKFKPFNFNKLNMIK